MTALPQVIPIPDGEPRRFAVLRSPAIPEFGFLIRTGTESRYGWEAWVAIRTSQARMRIASNAGELDAFAITDITPAIGAACGSVGVSTLFVQHAARSTTYRDVLAFPGVRVVDLKDYPIALLSRYGMEVIAGALTWVDWEYSRGIPRPITSDRLRFLECHISHLERDLTMERRFCPRSFIYPFVRMGK